MQIKDTNKDRRAHLVLALACFLLQVMIAPHVGMGNGRVNFAVVFTGAYALLVGGRVSVACGFFAGLLFDLLSTGPIGLMAALLTIFAYGLGLEERNRFADGFVASLSTFGVGSLAVIVAYHLTMVLLGSASSLVDLLLLRTLPTFALTFVAFLPFAYLQVNAATKRHGIGSGSKASSMRGGHYDMRSL